MNDTAAAVIAALILGGAVWWANRAPADQGGSDSGEDDSAPTILDYGAQALDVAQEYFDGTVGMDNSAAFLMAIRYGEGTSGANGYSILCGGGTFGSYADHPAMLGWRGLPLSDAMCAGAGYGPGCVSTAAGAFQINKPTWLRIAAKLRLTDFSPESQNLAALELIREKGAMADVLAGRIAAAVSKVRKVWASLPGAGYGQNEVALATFATHFQQNGGVIA